MTVPFEDLPTVDTTPVVGALADFFGNPLDLYERAASAEAPLVGTHMLRTPMAIVCDPDLVQEVIRTKEDCFSRGFLFDLRLVSLRPRACSHARLIASGGPTALQHSNSSNPISLRSGFRRFGEQQSRSSRSSIPTVRSISISTPADSRFRSPCVRSWACASSPHTPRPKCLTPSTGSYPGSAHR